MFSLTVMLFVSNYLLSAALHLCCKCIIRLPCCGFRGFFFAISTRTVGWKPKYWNKTVSIKGIVKSLCIACVTDKTVSWSCDGEWLDIFYVWTSISRWSSVISWLKGLPKNNCMEIIFHKLINICLEMWSGYFLCTKKVVYMWELVPQKLLH